MLRITSAIALLMIAIPSIAPAQVTAQLKPSRTSGVAPLVVLFDAQTTTHTNPAIKTFHDVTYTFTFGEKQKNPSYSDVWGSAAVWGAEADEFTQRHSKDTYFGGPIAGHVYERPGTYTASVTARDPNGVTSTKTVQIVVEDPNAVFAGEKTICVRANASGTFNGCPAGAVQSTNGSVSSIFGAATTGKRILLRRGDSFSGGGTLVNSGPGIIATFGSGAKPVLVGTTDPTTNGQVVNISGGSDWRVMDLRINLPLAPNPTQTMGFKITSPGVKQVLLLRNEVYGGNSSFGFADARGVRQNHIVECIAQPNINSNNTAASMSLELGNSFVAGNLVFPSFNHHNRNFGASDSAFQFNKYVNPHAKDRTTFIVTKYIDGLPTKHVVVGYNRWKNTRFAGAFSGSSDGKEAAEFSDAIVEGNFIGDTSLHFALNLVQRVTVRNNVWQTGSDGTAFIQVERRLPPTGITRDVFLINNTCVGLGAGTAGCLRIADPNTENIRASGNLLYAPNTQQLSILGGSFTAQASNTSVGQGQGTPLVSARPVRFPDFQVSNAKSGSGAGLGLWASIFTNSPVNVVVPDAPVLLSVTPVQ
jgi:hypothetical protein